jgi:hypothetical protein
LKAGLIAESQARPVVQPAAVELFHICESRAPGSVEFAIQQIRRIRRDRAEQRIQPGKLATDTLLLRDPLDCINRGGVTLIGEPGSGFSMQFFDLDESVIDRAGQVRAGAPGLPAADVAFIQDNDRLAFFSKKVSGVTRTTSSREIP